MNLARCTALPAALWAMISALAAESLLITNPSFEDIGGEIPSNEFTFGPLNGWGLYESVLNQTSGGAGPSYFIGTLGPRTFGSIGGIEAYFPGGAPDGERVGIAFNFQSSGNGGEYGFTQELSSTLQADTLYTLRVDVGNIGSGFAQSGSYFELSGFPGYRIDLMAGTQVLASDNNSLAGSLGEGVFATSTLNFQADSSHDSLLGLALSIRLVNLNIVDPDHEDSDLEVDFDNVRLDAVAVPEPSTWGLLALGGLALGLMWRRKDKARLPY